MDKNEFFDYLKQNGLENKEITIKVDGPDNKAVSGKKYVFFEAVKFIGEPDIRSSFYTPWYSQDEFLIIYKDIKVQVDNKDIRTYIEESYKQLYLQKDAAKAPEFLKDDLKEKPQILVCEYGLEKGKEYFAKFNVDHYYVNGPEGPKQRSNAVIWISGKPFVDGKPQLPLTPLYSGWSY